MLTDHDYHNLGVPTNPEVFSEPLRHITLRRFMRTFGVSDYARLRSDIGRQAVTKQDVDQGKFRTPSLREVARTAPYMHDGSLATLEEVIAFYHAGGGKAANKDHRLKPLGLTDEEQSALVAFLKTLSGDLPDVQPASPPPYQLRTVGEN